METKIAEIKKTYNDYYTSLFLKGSAPLKHTSLGLWGVAATDDVVGVFKRLQLSKYKRFIDLGSGDGKIVFLASLFTDATGIEVDPELITLSKDMQKRLKTQGTIVEGDYMQSDLSQYDLVFIHPDKEFYEIEKKIVQELQGTLVVYNAVFKPLQLPLRETFSIRGTEVCVYQK